MPLSPAERQQRYRARYSRMATALDEIGALVEGKTGEVAVKIAGIVAAARKDERTNNDRD